MLAAFLGTAPWTGLCLANGLIGFAILVFCRDPVKAVFPIAVGADTAAPLPRTAIAVTVRNEDPRLVLPPLRRLLDELDRAVTEDAFGVFILSDTLDPRAAAAEERAVAAFRDEDRDPDRICYRRRAANAGFKAGNVMDFLDHHAAGFELMVALDAEFRDVSQCGPADGAQHAGRCNPGDRAASDGGKARPVGVPAPVPVRNARRNAHLGDRAGLVAGG